MRFLVSGTLVLPFALSWWPRHLSWRATSVMTLCGPGAVYSVLMYLGLRESSVAVAGVFANGSLPVFTVLLAFVGGQGIPDRIKLLAIAIIAAGSLMVGLPGLQAVDVSVLSAAALFLCASAVLSIYLFGVRQWQISPRQALALVTLPNALVFLPIWYFFLPSGIADVDGSVILGQALYQGLGPGFFAVILFAIAITHLGVTPTAGVAASVPASAALLAMPFLQEYPSLIEWVGIVVVTGGLCLLFLWRPRRAQRVR